MNSKYIYPSLALGFVSIILFVFTVSLEPQSKWVLYTIASSVVFGLSSFIFYSWGAKKQTYSFLSTSYGFDLDRTLVDFVMPVTVSNAISAHFSAPRGYLIALCVLDDSLLKFVEIDARNKNSVINTFDMKVTDILKIEYKKALDATTCHVTINGLSNKMSDRTKAAMYVDRFHDKSYPDTLIVSTITSRNKFDTEQAVKLLNGSAAKFAIPLVDN